jgi:thioredoxin-like negative regulator of GroEL
MAWDVTGLEELRSAVEEAPHDPFNRCNLACALASSGAIDEALLQLAAAVNQAHGQISAGCVASAVRDVADSLAQA